MTRSRKTKHVGYMCWWFLVSPPQSCRGFLPHAEFHSLQAKVGGALEVAELRLQLDR